ncbi:MAG TPA: lipopolysaccharide biosynthesis protein [Azospirillum sp.]|nr:lipopolysaccharide biosynthesis protein [Azospirillum sp.]
MASGSLLRKMVSYTPAVVVPAALQFLTVIVFTHLISPEAFGRYALVMVTVQLLDIVLFGWLRSGEMRFYEPRAAAGAVPALFANTQAMLLAIGVLVLGAGIPAALWLVPDRALALAMASGLVLLVLRAALLQVLNRHRVRGEALRYSMIEIGRASVSLLTAVLLAVLLGLEEQALLLGAVAVFALILLADLPAAAVRFSGGAFDGATTRACLAFGLPATLAVVLADLVALSDRYIIGLFWGEEAVGVYSVAGNLSRQSIALLFSVTLVAAYPMLMRAFEREGMESARRRLRENFAIVLALCVPATVGLALTAEHVAVACLGEQYRAAGALMPWLAVAAFLSGVKIHVYDHVFHLKRRTGLLLLLNVPIAVLNVGLNLLLVPAWGVAGAMTAMLASYAGGLVLTICAATWLMPVPVPVDTVWRSLLAAGVMAVALILPAYPLTPAGLAAMVAAGVAVYAAAGLALNLLGCRTFVLAAMQRMAQSARSS